MASSFTSHQAGTALTDAATREVVKEEFAKGVACVVILQGPGEVPFVRVVAYQDDPRKMWDLLHQGFVEIKCFENFLTFFIGAKRVQRSSSARIFCGVGTEECTVRIDER